MVGGPTDGRDIVISDHYEAKKRQLKGHGWRFGETHESFSTASVSRPSAGATVGLLSASSGPRRLPKTDLRLCIPIVRSVESSLEHADEAIVEEPQEAE